jgi:hypothetical protein
VVKSAFVVLVPEAEALVGDLRLQYDQSARLGVPAHVTVLYPFMEPSLITPEVTRECASVLAGLHSFAFVLGSVCRFLETAYLDPEPHEPFIALTSALARAFPAFPPSGGKYPSIVPHLTVAHGNAAEAESAAVAVAAGLRSSGPISSVCASVMLMENSSGRWRPMHVFPLASAPGT